MIKPILHVGPKEKCVRSLMSLDVVQRFAPGLAARVCNPGSSFSREFIIDFHGYHYRGEIKNHLDWCAYFLKYFAVAEARFVESVANFVKRQQQRFDCLEIGANVGLRTLMMARVADDVIALEPVPGAFERLDEKIRSNRLHHVRYFETMMDESAGDLEFEVVSPSNFVAVRKQSSLTKGAFGSFVVPAVKGDDFLNQQQMDSPNFIRIDARSDALRVLRGLVETLHQAQPVVLIECPLIRWGEAIDEDSLRSVLYDDVEIATLNDSVLDGTFSIGPFEPMARKLVCFPSALRRMAEQEACKRLGLGLSAAGGA